MLDKSFEIAKRLDGHQFNWFTFKHVVTQDGGETLDWIRITKEGTDDHIIFEPEELVRMCYMVVGEDEELRAK